MSAHASAAVLVLNYNGLEHLKTCLPSLERLDYQGARLVVVDNGSTDGSLAYVRERHPGVEVLALGSNKGFAGGYNAAIERVDCDWVALLNNDTHVDPAWLTELVGAAERHGAAAAAAEIVDWDGSRIDFVGGLPTFIGHSWQIDYGQPVGKTYAERPLLFGCGGSVLIRRDAYLDSGGLDTDFFAYFEDVDLGWRMNLLGHTTVFAPGAITYHRLHGTFGSLAHALRLRLYERNALYTIFKNYDDENLARVLPAAILLTIGRSLTQAGLESYPIEFGRTSPTTATIPAQVAAYLIALEDFASSLPGLWAKRRQIQSRRRVADEDVLALMPDPLKLHDLSDVYRDTAEALIRDFRIHERFGLPAPAPRVPVPDMTSPHIEVSPAADLVSVVVLTASGAVHLPDCLDALRSQTWPAASTEVIVVDNGSREDPTVVVERHYPGARVVRTGRNLGFSAGNNAGARKARGGWLLFLNDDTKCDPNCVSALMDVASRRGAASVAARIVDWGGQHIDFAGGLVNFEGRGYPLGWDRAVDEFPVKEEPVLFGCGAAVLFRRDVFDATGGWDEPTFAYYEDVEFGWRLWVLGHEVWFAPEAVVRHKHHGTSGAESPARTRAFERNALRMLYALLEDRTLQHVLPAALLLATDRITLGTPFSRATMGIHGARGYSLGDRLSPGVLRGRLLYALSRRGAQRKLGVMTNLARVGAVGLLQAGWEAAHDIAFGWAAPPARQRLLIEQGTSPHEAAAPQIVPIQTIAALRGFQDFFEMVPELSARRAWLQANRKRSDVDILGRFGSRWRNAVASPEMPLHLELRAGVVATLTSTLARLGPEVALQNASEPGFGTDAPGDGASSMSRPTKGWRMWKGANGTVNRPGP
jgi:GT2 family glycosyltransferase